MSLTTPLSAEIDILRQKARDGELSLEEMKAVIARVREGRMSSASDRRRAVPRAKITSFSEDVLLDGLD